MGQAERETMRLAKRIVSCASHGTELSLGAARVLIDVLLPINVTADCDITAVYRDTWSVKSVGSIEVFHCELEAPGTCNACLYVTPRSHQLFEPNSPRA